jgi:hypothetical protein
MTGDPVLFALKTPGHLIFPSNRVFLQGLEPAGGRVVRKPSGHLVFYGPDGRRFLAVDPAGNPLHECEWQPDARGEIVLVRARIRLDWGAWVGILPGGLVNETILNLAAKPGWQQVTPDDLRNMAAQALRVPLDEVRWFYRDEDLSISQDGKATIRHRKDAFYKLEDGTFERARFMSCMGAMHWAAIDFLPVVELFKSLLPGTGSAAFELIRGLYDDQNEGRPTSLPLRYRGIPTYPSEAAFRLFSSFFAPQPTPAGDPFAVFMDPPRSHQVEWLPAASPPLRYFDADRRCCLTFQGGDLQKVTLADDPSGLPFVNPKGRPWVFCDRTASIINGRIVIKDRDQETVLAVPLPEGYHERSAPVATVSPVDWRCLFERGVPPVSPAEAFGAVLLYPQDDAEIGELAAQPFVADYIQDLAEQDRMIGTVLTRAERVLIENGDAVIATCVAFDRPRDYTARVRVPAFAQRQAQQVWGLCAELRRWDWLKRIRLVLATDLDQDPLAERPFDLVYRWVPYAVGDNPALWPSGMRELSRLLRDGGHAFVTGPSGLVSPLAAAGLRVSWQEPVDGLPTFRMHRTILPKARLKAGLTLFHVVKS